ncbi:hypothetical protein F2P81_023117 [Scophthalmus maximus]|uniref:Rel homology dimerisation domain-containing protein n=1 Tax=Scophthalmus maximus TaxID=52904 RepID=A0A6A4RVT1_SCOMX|nr:hypothetical protein F2P81_023117 [Scophthalmus maximus]
MSSWAADGHHIWETEAKVDRDVSKSTSLLVEVPPYRSQRLSTPAHVNFYVCNGKRKRSQYQRFTYVPASGEAPLLSSPLLSSPLPFPPPDECRRRSR